VLRTTLFFFFLLCCLDGLTPASAQQPNGTQPNEGQTLLMRSLLDITDTLTLPQVLNHPFPEPDQPMSLIGFTSHPVWYRFTVGPKIPAGDYYIQVTNWFLDDADLYIPQPNGQYNLEQAGDRLPFAQRKVQVRFPTFPVQLSGSQAMVFFLRVRSTQHINLKINLIPARAFASSQNTTDATSFTLGLSVMRLVFHLALLLLMYSDKRFRAYSLYGVSVCLAYIFSAGNGSVLFPHSPYWANQVFLLATSLVPITVSFYVGTLFDVRQNFPRLVPLFWLVVCACVLHMGVSLLEPSAYLTRALLLLFFAVMIGLGVLAMVAYFRQIRPSIWYVIPLLMYAPPYLYLFLRNLIQHRHAAIFVGNTGQEGVIRFTFVLEFLFVPFLLVVMLRQAHRDRWVISKTLYQRQAEHDSLQQLDALKTKFFANISHEFRTPLTLVLSPLTDLKQRFPQETVLDLIERNGQRLLDLINQLLDLGKLEAGQLKPEPQPGDLAIFFRTLAASFDSMAQNKGISFAFTQNADTVWANFDADKLEKIVMNLLGNAFKFTPSGGAVQMQVAYTPPGGITLTVTDTGIGIAPEHLPHLFERFYQQPSQATGGQSVSYYEGTGIGLALVNELVQVLGGKIEVKSEVGKGTRFEVSLPAEAIPGSQTGENKTNWLLQAVDTPSVKIVGTQLELPTQIVEPTQFSNVLLIIDDNADIRAYVRSVFADDYQILEAEDGQQGLEVATETLPDMVICDLMMPRLDGFGFCRTLKTQDTTSHIPVVMLTARATVEDRIEGFELGADDYLTKPFNRDEIRARVRNLMEQRARLKQLLSYRAGSPQTNISPQPDLNPQSVAREDAFVQKSRTLVLEHLTDKEFDVEQFSTGLNMSSRQVVRKLRALTDQTAVEFIRNVRLEQATILLKAGQPVSEVAYAVGFESLPYFTKIFSERYGKSPSSYQKTP
jgi:signal transduction histidine kinase/DNA-binding response OmpR family regulator